MAIAFDSVTNSSVFASSSAPTLSRTISGGLSNPIHVVLVPARGSSSDANLNASSVVCGSDNFTRAVRAFEGDAGGAAGSLDVEIWYKVNPTSGTNTITVTYPGTVNHGQISSIVLTGVDQSSPIDNTASYADAESAVASPAQLNITTNTNNAWLVGAMYHKIGNAITVQTNNTERMNGSPNGGGDKAGSSTRGPVTPAGASSLGWTYTGSDAYAFAAIALKAAATDVTVNAGVQSVTSSQPTATVTPVRNVTVSPSVQSITGNIISPSVSIHETISPNSQDVTAARPSPTVSTTRNLSFSASAQTVAFATPTPTVTPVINISISQGVQDANFALPAPQVTAAINISVSPNVQSLSANQIDPTVSAIRNVSRSASVQEITSSLANPTIVTVRNLEVSASVQSLLSSILSPSVTTGRDITASLAVQALAMSLIAPTITATGPSITDVVFYQDDMTDVSGGSHSLADGTVYDDDIDNPASSSNSIADQVIYDENL